MQEALMDRYDVPGHLYGQFEPRREQRNGARADGELRDRRRQNLVYDAGPLACPHHEEGVLSSSKETECAHLCWLERS